MRRERGRGEDRERSNLQNDQDGHNQNRSDDLATVRSSLPLLEREVLANECSEGERGALRIDLDGLSCEVFLSTTTKFNFS